MFHLVGDQNFQWASIDGYTFVMPAVSVGNIGQLAVDLLISSLRLTKMAKLEHPVFVPVIGNDPYDLANKSLMTAAELYISKEKKLVVLQIRSLLVKAHCSDFLQRLADWVKTCKFHQVVLLSSSYSYERIDCQLTGSQFRYSTTSTVQPEIIEEFNRLEWIPLEPRRPVLVPNGQQELFFPGGGYTKQWNTICQDKSIALVTLLIFCAEGENIPSVLLVADHLERWLGFVGTPVTDNKSGAWKLPSSWKLFYGNPAPATMY